MVVESWPVSAPGSAALTGEPLHLSSPLLPDSAGWKYKYKCLWRRPGGADNVFEMGRVTEGKVQADMVIAFFVFLLSRGEVTVPLIKVYYSKNNSGSWEKEFWAVLSGRAAKT